MSAFSERLRLLRTTSGLSQRELAQKIGVSKSSINMYERGEREPGFETLESVADLFRVDINYLLGRTDDPHSGTKKQAAETGSLPKEEITEQVISLFRKMNARERREFLSLALHEFDEQLQEEAAHEPDKPDS